MIYFDLFKPPRFVAVVVSLLPFVNWCILPIFLEIAYVVTVFILLGCWAYLGIAMWRSWRLIEWNVPQISVGYIDSIIIKKMGRAAGWSNFFQMPRWQINWFAALAEAKRYGRSRPYVCDAVRSVFPKEVFLTAGFGLFLLLFSESAPSLQSLDYRYFFLKNNQIIQFCMRLFGVLLVYNVFIAALLCLFLKINSSKKGEI